MGPDSIEDFKGDLTRRNLEFDTMIEDTQALTDNEFLCCSNYTADGSEDNFDNCYRKVDEVGVKIVRTRLSGSCGKRKEKRT